MSGLIKQDSTRYRHATMEALALAAWLKRFAEALAPED
jgi:CRISPR/Cas system CMR-associated protein Cmr5 small subunit